jgi:uncharacterized protein YndB with AHSA1/START domain
MTNTAKNSDSPWADWPLDQEIVLSRLIDAPRDLVFKAWSDPEHIVAWFGPAGMAIETHEIDIREGGRWRFDMVTEDGTRYSNRMLFRRIIAPKMIEVEHGEDVDDDPAKFRMLVTFDEQSNGKTILTLRQMHPTAALRAEKMGFGAVEYGGQTLDKLARFVEKMRGA